MSWPNNMDNLVPVVTGTPISEFVENEQSAAINGLEATLGLNPQGSFPTVQAFLASLMAYALVPTGAIVQNGFSATPAGFLVCNGAAVSRTTYSNLFAVISTVFGAGDGVTTFNVPNLVAVPSGATPSPVTALGVQGTTYSLAGTGGEASHVLSAAEIPSHSHSLTGPCFMFASGTVHLTTGGSGSFDGTFQSSLSTDASGSGQGHPNLQPYLVLNFLIKT